MWNNRGINNIMGLLQPSELTSDQQKSDSGFVYAPYINIGTPEYYKKLKLTNLTDGDFVPHKMEDLNTNVVYKPYADVQYSEFTPPKEPSQILIKLDRLKRIIIIWFKRFRKKLPTIKFEG